MENDQSAFLIEERRKREKNKEECLIDKSNI